MSDFLSHLVERSLAGSDTVRPQLGSIFEPPPNDSATSFDGEENREAAAAVAQNRHANDRVLRVESLWQPSPKVSAQEGAVSPPVVVVSPAVTAPPLQPPLRMASTLEEQHTNTDRREPETTLQDEDPPKRPVKLASDEIRSQELREIRIRKVIDLIRRETPAQREPHQAPKLRVRFQSPASFRLSSVPAEKREVSPAPSINVTIGRVEVRATLSQEKALQKPRTSPPIMSLEKYLRERAGGNRK